MRNAFRCTFTLCFISSLSLSVDFSKINSFFPFQYHSINIASSQSSSFRSHKQDKQNARKATISGKSGVLQSKHSRVSFCDGSFYDDSLSRPLSSLTEHSRLAVYHCRNSSVLSLLSALPALFRCARVSSFSILEQFF